MALQNRHTELSSFAPVFIGGCPRSGTTLLGSVLGSIPGCTVTYESQFKNTLWRASNGGRKELDPNAVAGLLEKQFRYRLWELPPTTDFMPPGGQGVSETLRLLVSEYARRRGESKPIHWIDHTPRNLRHASVLLEMFPQARFIHIVRDGRAVASSVIPLDWGPNTPAAAARWWAGRLGEGVVAEGYLAHRAVVHQVRFEDLVRNPRETLATLIKAVFGSEADIDLTGLGNAIEVPEYTRSQHQLIGKPPDPSRVEAWKTKLSEADIEEFEFIAGGFLTHLGYETECQVPRGPSTRTKVQRNFMESWRGMANSLRRRTRVRRGGG